MRGLVLGVALFAHAAAAAPRDSAPRTLIFTIGPGASHPNARTMLFLDAYTNEVLRFTPYARSSFGRKLYFWMLSWHTGKSAASSGHSSFSPAPWA